MKEAIEMSIKVVERNKKALYEYSILEKYEAGIVLTGTEIKSVAAGKVSLSDSYITVEGKNASIMNMNIAPYEYGTCWNHKEKRPRSLLMHKWEMRKLEQEVKEKGLTIIPLSLYINERGKAKLEIALARGKHNYDKRENIKQRDVERSFVKRQWWWQ